MQQNGQQRSLQDVQQEPLLQQWLIPQEALRIAAACLELKNQMLTTDGKLRGWTHVKVDCFDQRPELFWRFDLWDAQSISLVGPPRHLTPCLLLAAGSLRGAASAGSKSRHKREVDRDLQGARQGCALIHFKLVEEPEEAVGVVPQAQLMHEEQQYVNALPPFARQLVCAPDIKGLEMEIISPLYQEGCQRLAMSLSKAKLGATVKVVLGGDDIEDKRIFAGEMQKAFVFNGANGTWTRVARAEL